MPVRVSFVLWQFDSCCSALQTMFCFGRRAERQPSGAEPQAPPKAVARAPAALPRGPTDDAVSDLSSDGKYELDIPTLSEFTLAGGRDLKYIDSDRQEAEDDDISEADSSADPEDVFLAGAVPPPLAENGVVPLSSVSSDDSANLRVPEVQDGGASSASTVEIGRLMSSSSHRSCTSVESTNYSAADLTNLVRCFPVFHSRVLSGYWLFASSMFIR